MARKKATPNINQVDTLLASFLERGPVKKPTADQEAVNEILVKRDGASSIVERLRLAEKLRTVIIRMVYGASDPREVPIEEMQHALMNPVGFTAFADMTQRKTINGPLRGIRIKCFECQGGDLNGVRECAATNCPLWPFRMNSNPFYGRLSNEEADAEDNETLADIEAMEAAEQPKDV